MRLVRPQSSFADQIYEAVVDDICSGALAAGSHLVQEQIAARFGVSRQPVQQAMVRLKADGMVEEAGRRGLWVTPLEPGLMRHHYDIRAVLDGLAARLAAERLRATPGLAAPFRDVAADRLAAGIRAAESGDVAEQVRQDLAFHNLIYDASGNPLLARTAEPHWRFLRRAMGEVLRRATLPQEIWRQHAGIVAAIAAADPEEAETAMLRHDLEAARMLHAALDAASEATRARPTRPRHEGARG